MEDGSSVSLGGGTVCGSKTPSQKVENLKQRHIVRRSSSDGSKIDSYKQSMMYKFMTPEALQTHYSDTGTVYNDDYLHPLPYFLTSFPYLSGGIYSL